MIYVYLEAHELGFKKNCFETITYALDLAKHTQEEVIGICLSHIDSNMFTQAENFGLKKIIQLYNPGFSNFDAQLFSKIIAHKIKTEHANIVFSNTVQGKYLAPRVAMLNHYSFLNNIIGLPENLVFKKNVYSGKAIQMCKPLNTNWVIAIASNSYHITEQKVSCNNSVENIDIDLSKIKCISSEKTSDTISLVDAEIVVAGGRGLKGPENWGIIEELAKILGAATACSRPVADLHWRPHHEHVGQTGIQINPNLYIAIGISGAIQHLAGVNRSKHIVVINIDPEAPFVKACDYAVIGDCFQVVPKLIDAIKQVKK